MDIRKIIIKKFPILVWGAGFWFQLYWYLIIVYLLLFVRMHHNYDCGTYFLGIRFKYSDVDSVNTADIERVNTVYVNLTL